MSVLVNTVDFIGDEALTNSIIDGSVTEIVDSLATTVAANCLRYRTALKSVKFATATNVGKYAFSYCSALKTADFEVATSIDSSSFSRTALETLILRSETQCSLQNQNAFNQTPIASGTGYIYVPAALVDSYKTATNWSTYANQIRAIEDYPEVCDPYSWEAVSIAIEKGTYKDMYKIGDCVPVDLGSEGIINMQIAAFDADTLADGSGTAAISWVAVELLKTGHRMNPANSSGAEGTGTNGGWEKCEMRAYLDSTIKPIVPTNVQNMIVTVSKSQNAPDGSKSILQTTADFLWIPSASEVGGSAAKETNLPKYSAVYVGNASRIKNQVGVSYADNWYTRSASPNNVWSGFNASGKAITPDGTTAFGPCLGFCTGRTPT